MNRYQIAGAHTDVGKTYVACALLRAARAQGHSVSVFKPVVSGLDPAAIADSDPGRLMAAAGLGIEALEAVSPLRFAAPLAPPQAAKREGARLRLADLVDRSRAWLARPAEFGLIETAGGVMSPIAEDGLCLDLMARLPLPVVLVGGGYLGAISHTLTALAVLKSARLAVRAVVVSQDGSPDAPDFAETVAAVRTWAGDTPVVAAARNDESWAAALVETPRA